MSNLPETSHLSNKDATLQMRQCHWLKIKEALSVLKLATGEQIAVQAGMDYHAVMRRVGEMERMEMIYKPGTKALTKTNRLAFQYALRNPETVLPPPEPKYPEGIVGSDFASLLVNKKENLKQQKLFE